jgi:hypothetical protein
MRPASVEVVRVAGRVDVLPRGQTTWTPVTVGARLVEGDQVRALAGGAADLTLPDGSTILVAENSRFAVTKLDYDAATRDRDASFHDRQSVALKYFAAGWWKTTAETEASGSIM